MVRKMLCVAALAAIGWSVPTSADAADFYFGISSGGYRSSPYGYAYGGSPYAASRAVVPSRSFYGSSYYSPHVYPHTYPHVSVHRAYVPRPSCSPRVYSGYGSHHHHSHHGGYGRSPFGY